MTLSARITGSGSYLPAKVLTNKDLEGIVDTTEDWIYSRSGIRQRHIAAEGEFTSDLALAASREALQSAGRAPSDVDLIVVATTTADQVFPSTACLLQQRLGIHGCPAFDVQAVCAGFLYALDVVYRYVATGASQCALVVGAETFSRILNWEDRTTCVLFGDGAGAMVVEASESPGEFFPAIFMQMALLKTYSACLWVYRPPIKRCWMDAPIPRCRVKKYSGGQSQRLAMQ